MENHPTVNKKKNKNKMADGRYVSITAHDVRVCVHTWARGGGGGGDGDDEIRGKNLFLFCHHLELLFTWGNEKTGFRVT